MGTRGKWKVREEEKERRDDRRERREGCHISQLLTEFALRNCRDGDLESTDN